MSFDKARRFSGALLLAAAAFAVFATVGAPAQEKVSVSSKENEYGKKMQDPKTDMAGKMKIVEKFMKEFPKSELRPQVARYIANQIWSVEDATQRAAYLDTYMKLFNTPQEADYAAPARIDLYSRQNKYDDEFKTATDYFSRPFGENDLRMRVFVAINGATLAYGGDTKFADQTIEIASQAINVIEMGTKPADVPEEDWKLAQTTWKAQLYRSIGFVQNAQKMSELAQGNFEKAVAIDPTDVTSWVMLGTLLDTNYQALAARYKIENGPKQAETLKQAQAEMDKVVDIFARVVALTDGDPQQAQLNQQIRSNLEIYYKFRHNNSTAGMDELIKKYKK